MHHQPPPWSCNVGGPDKEIPPQTFTPLSPAMVAPIFIRTSGVALLALPHAPLATCCWYRAKLGSLTIPLLRLWPKNHPAPRISALPLLSHLNCCNSGTTPHSGPACLQLLSRPLALYHALVAFLVLCLYPSCFPPSFFERITSSSTTASSIVTLSYQTSSTPRVLPERASKKLN